jgi:hypothetical protein
MKRFAICGAAVAFVGALSFLAPTSPVRAQAPDKAKLAEKAKGILYQYCFECHGEAKLKGKFDIRDHKTLMDQKNVKGTHSYLVKTGGKDGLKDSFLWIKIANGSMPQGDELKADDKTALQSWIEAGAPAWGEVQEKREFVSQEMMLQAIYDDLKEAEVEDRPYIRYFVLNHLHNNPSISNETLTRYKAALSKAFNSMHWKKPIVLLRALKAAHGTVFAFDLRDADWDRQYVKDKHGREEYEKLDRWTVMLQHYPYGIRYDDSDDDKLSKLDRELFGDEKARTYGLANRTLVYIRADWFVAMATRPPVYERVLRLPGHAGELEKKLGVDVVKNFRRNRLARAGYTSSGVSSQNRLVERHDSLYGAYWKSYDFKPKADQGDLLRFPLGPLSFRTAFNGKYPYDDVAFKHDGGEMIFNLPNGLQGYYLAKGDDTFLDVGPSDVVYDKLKTSGSGDIVNGLSCMACHARGMIESVKDEVRLGTSVSSENRRKVRRIYVPYETMMQYVENDSKVFQEAARKAMAPFMPKEEDLKAAFEDKTEPIGELARRYYNTDVTLDTAAYELGYQDPKILAAIIKASPKLRDLGLGGLANGGKVKREFWDKLKGRSVFQGTMFSLDKGRPWNYRP